MENEAGLLKANKNTSLISSHEIFDRFGQLNCTFTRNTMICHEKDPAMVE